jgi:hypothetical protein
LKKSAGSDKKKKKDALEEAARLEKELEDRHEAERKESGGGGNTQDSQEVIELLVGVVVLLLRKDKNETPDIEDLGSVLCYSSIQTFSRGSLRLKHLRKGLLMMHKDTTVNQAYGTGIFPCHTHPLQDHVEVLSSPGPSLGWCVFVLPEKSISSFTLGFKYALFSTGCHHANKSAAAAEQHNS